MGYVIAGIIVLAVVGAFITFFIINATRKGGPAAPADPGAEGNPAGIAAPDSSPLGDTSQHAGDQREGASVDQPAEGRGEAEGETGKPRVGDPGPEAATPESERLANRPR
jgi:hypothetical protein